MLKRQRSTPSFVPDAYFPQEPAFDMSERVAKRRRQFEPPQFQATDKGKAPWRGGDSDEEEDVEGDEQTVAARSAPSEHAQRLAHAGEYKHVNSLLHDLHAEQRHRVLFSSTSPPSQIPLASPIHPHPDFGHSLPSAPNKVAPTVSAQGMLLAPPHEVHRPSAPFTISTPFKDTSVVDHIEVQRVTQQYEDTNRYLGALFLSRRKQHNGQDTQNRY
ncbi:hypothetical protein BD310DRAFT_1034543 [Dichomitus squalens]|uniref:Uncharacterized protein n=1 Tax=Dichomitus squalens TaxID=114155 RepID=A0A4Q9QB06_9APHY|nr:hypothetical protein BD310DRAFT_1034543 [Dichomitus squalens]